MKKIETKTAAKKKLSKAVSRKRQATKVNVKASQPGASQFDSAQQVLIEQLENKGTDFNILEKEMEIKKRLAAMFTITSIESYLSSNDPSNALREVRKTYLNLLIQAATLAGEETPNPKEPDKAKAFIEGLSFSKSERIQELKGYFLARLLLFAKLPLDPRDEIELMIKALEEVRKTLPKRKPGRREDEFIKKAWLRIDRENTPHRKAYESYRQEMGLPENYLPAEFKEFQAQIRKKRSEENKKQGEKKVANKSKLQRRNSGS
jgi:hypothetical protein